jgi:hypothetical protein
MSTSSPASSREHRALGGAISVEVAPSGARAHVHASNLTPAEMVQLGALLGAEGRARMGLYVAR